MGKRSDFEKRPRDYYPTPLKAVVPLRWFLPDYFTFIEPCAGDGRLVNHIYNAMEGDCECLGAYDIEHPEHDPLVFDVELRDALSLSDEDVKDVDYIITNPPWSRDKKSGYILHKMIEHFAELAPTWLLFDADWIHTKQAAPLIDKYLMQIVSIGRVSWEENGVSGKDNVAWYLFHKDARKHLEHPEFFPNVNRTTPA